VRIPETSERGNSMVEFCFASLVLVPLFLGTVDIGTRMIGSQQTVQLARDAGHMYARGTDFTKSGNLSILTSLGSGVGLSSVAGSGPAVVFLSSITYVDTSLCAAAGKVNAQGNPSGCTNYTHWVFTKRLVIGNGSLRSSSFGSPVTTGANPVTLAADGSVSLLNQAANSGDVATFTAISPYRNVNGVVSGLPSGQVVHVCEAATRGRSILPGAGTVMTYAYNLF
jgi:hypothetical protein